MTNTYLMMNKIILTPSLLEGAREASASSLSAGRLGDAGIALSDWFERLCDENSVNDFAWSVLCLLMGNVDWEIIAESVWESMDDSGYGPGYADVDRLTYA